MEFTTARSLTCSNRMSASLALLVPLECPYISIVQDVHRKPCPMALFGVQLLLDHIKDVNIRLSIVQHLMVAKYFSTWR